MAAYLFELGYELALARRDNVSDSPGFEGCGLIFDKTGWKKIRSKKQSHITICHLIVVFICFTITHW
jgi:hypothetical protein